MKLYFALSTDTKGNRPLVDSDIHYTLASFFYFGKGASLKIVREMGLINDDTLWDSGAFSAYNSKKPINLNTYIKFIKDNDLKIYASLDDISSPDKSIENFEIMKRAGLSPIPCFHIGEDIKYLDHMIDEPYIALGGMVMAGNLEDWLDRVFNYIYKIRPDMKIHGFGLTDPNLILRYPWYSVDSSSWVGCVRFARYSRWTPGPNKFFSIGATEFFKSVGIDYSDGPIIGLPRRIMITSQIHEFKDMEEYLLHKKSTKDYSYITSQQTLF